MPESVKNVLKAVRERIDGYHIRCFEGMTKPLFLVSTCYPGVWLEHANDACAYAKLEPSQLSLARNTVELFLDRQTPEGQFPCYVWDHARLPDRPIELLTGYCQIQECLSFATVCLDVCNMTGDRDLLVRCYGAIRAWDGWQRKYRMTSGRGLVEMFCGFDTGHDNSGRLLGMKYPDNYKNFDYTAQDFLPDGDVTPILAVDMNCNFYGTQKKLAEMARQLGKEEEAAEWEEKAKEVKKNLFLHCFDEDDVFFYDCDKCGRKRRVRSSTILHLFLEHVLDPQEDAELIEKILRLHVLNPEEFWTPYPFPSVAYNDPTAKNHTPSNSWGYFSQGNIALRATRWMDDYGLSEELDTLCERWIEAWTRAFPDMKLGQELDPITGEPSSSSEYYSPTIIFFLYAVRRLESKGKLKP